jgi:hypothetical protein
VFAWRLLSTTNLSNETFSDTCQARRGKPRPFSSPKITHSVFLAFDVSIC